MLIIDCDVCKINTSSQILTLTFCAWSLFTTCNLFSKAGLHIYARAAARGKRVQVKTSFFSSLIFSCAQVHACTCFYFRKRLWAWKGGSQITIWTGQVCWFCGTQKSMAMTISCCYVWPPFCAVYSTTLFILTYWVEKLFYLNGLQN